MKKLLLCVFLCAQLTYSCQNGNSSDAYQQPPFPAQPSYNSPPAASVEVVNEGSVAIEDNVEISEDATEPYEPSGDMPVSAINRMQQLLNNPNFVRRNGNCMRLKIAKKLNEEGFTKTDGSRFKLRDIPKC